MLDVSHEACNLDQAPATLNAGRVCGTLSCALQATIAGEAPAGSRAVLKCKVQDGPWLRMCSLREGGTECCGLDLIYDQYTEFVVEGDAGLHLTGRWTEARSSAGCPARCILCMQ